MNDLSEQMILASFNEPKRNVYQLLSILGKNIGSQFCLMEYISENGSFYNSYALFYSRLEYYHTYVFVLKNFRYKESRVIDLFGNIQQNLEYLLNIPYGMYLVIIYSDHIKDFSDVEILLNSKELDIQLYPVQSKKIKNRIHHYIESRINFNNDCYY